MVEFFVLFFKCQLFYLVAKKARLMPVLLLVRKILNTEGIYVYTVNNMVASQYLYFRTVYFYCFSYYIKCIEWVQAQSS